MLLKLSGGFPGTGRIVSADLRRKGSRLLRFVSKGSLDVLLENRNGVRVIAMNEESSRKRCVTS